MSDDSELPSRPGGESLAYVCWRNGDGTRVAGCPLDRPHAEALARAYAQFFPGLDYWVEEVPWLALPRGSRVTRSSH